MNCNVKTTKNNCCSKIPSLQKINSLLIKLLDRINVTDILAAIHSVFIGEKFIYEKSVIMERREIAKYAEDRLLLEKVTSFKLVLLLIKNREA